MIKKIILSISSICVLAIGYVVLDNILFNGVKPKQIEEKGFQANLYSSDNIKNKPAIIVIGGGKWGDYWGQEFTKQGYACLSLPYYRMKGMPQLMEEIPLEYFENAIKWFVKQPQVNPKNL